MFDSLKSWMNVPVTRMPFVSLSGSGVKTFGASEQLMCAPTGKVKKFTDANGEQVVSNNQLFVDSTATFLEQDHVVFGGREYPIKQLGTHYRAGQIDLWELYL